jgi:phage shock protein A
MFSRLKRWAKLEEENELETILGVFGKAVGQFESFQAKLKAKIAANEAQVAALTAANAALEVAHSKAYATYLKLKSFLE